MIEPRIFHGDALDHYASWPRPRVIVSDGAYGVGGFAGDPKTPAGLADWYEPHARAWALSALPSATLWFWNTEIGWATVHPLLMANGWEYRSCHIWNKGMAHAAGNSNTKTLRKYPVVSEVCVQYVRDVRLMVGGSPVSLKDWLRCEWARSGLPFTEANRACGVKNAATRKYFTRCHLWYPPPPAAFDALAAYANQHGRIDGRPYFSLDGSAPLAGRDWGELRATFHCEPGITNVWNEPPVRGNARLKAESRVQHPNQKPLRLMERIVRASSDIGDVLWEPFGGLCSASVASSGLNRFAYAAEKSDAYYRLALARVRPAQADGKPTTVPLAS